MICIMVFAPVQGAETLIISADTSTFLMRLPDPLNIAEYKFQKEFNYGNSDNTGILARAIPQWLKSFLRDLHRLVSSFGDFELFIIILLALIFTAIILKVNDIDPVSLFRHRNKQLPSPFESVPENLRRLDFPLMIAQAVEAGNYRHAVRYQYLQALSLLAMKGKIQLKEEKTNREYVAELGSGELKDNFLKLVYGFEFVWYGEFIPDEKLYLQLDSAFLSFKNMLQV
ncbi:MAG: DUF4129 domain-containing protein [Lentimicrobium sp.]